MQLIWVPGPTARVVVLSITRRSLAWALALVGAGILAVGVSFPILGLRVAVEHVPELAHRMGGVTSQGEQERTEQAYRSQLQRLQQQLAALSERLGQVETAKRELLQRLGLEALLRPGARASPAGADHQGGPMRQAWSWPSAPAALAEEFRGATARASQLDAALARAHDELQASLGRIDLLPTSLPLAEGFRVTSGFGLRLDPFNGLPSLHEGIDLVAEPGTPVRATAPGLVLRSQEAGPYGQLVEVAHADGFITRYAHLQIRHVKPGDAVARGQVLGLLGNTGRSSGPHLHYEVVYNGRPMHPARAIAAWSRH